MEINRSNYETFFLLYLDRELNAPEMSEVENFLDENADLKKEFSLFEQTILIPSPVVFDQKELLLRKEEKRRVVPIFWTRIAAAVIVLLFGGWLISSQLAKKQAGGIADTGSGKKITAGSPNSTDRKLNEAKVSDQVMTDSTGNKIQTGQQNLSVIKNQPARNKGTAENKARSGKEADGKNNPALPLVNSKTDRVNPSSMEDQGASDLAMQKSSIQEVQPAEKNLDPTVAAVPGSQSPVTLIAVTNATGKIPHVQDENAVLKENEDQGDNAISVVALNDRNKAVTGFFKKLTRRAPADEKARKVRVSVFQFSY